MKKIVIITQHLSTGGLPQYILKKVEILNEIYDLYVIELNNFGDDLIVQRSAIRNIIGDKLIHLYNTDYTLREQIDILSPDIVWFEEIAEFILDDVSDIWEDRDYEIYESTHTSQNLIDYVKHLPDKFVFVSKLHNEYYKELDVPMEFISYPVDIKTRNKKEMRQKLNFDDDKIHIVQVGLISEHKNQKYTIELAKELDVVYHFVGNMADSNMYYWEDIIKDLPHNCILHGEVDNVDDYIQAADLAIHPSTEELNPLVIKEYLQYEDLPILISPIKTHIYEYENNNRITFLTNNIGKDIELIARKSIFEKIEIIQISTIPETDRYLNSMKDFEVIKGYGIDIKHVRNLPYDGEIDLDKAKDIHRETLHSRHYGCYLGHKEAIQNISTNKEYTLIIEEDCGIVDMNDFLHILLQSIKVFRKNSDVKFISFDNGVDNGEVWDEYFNVNDWQIKTTAYMVRTSDKNWYLDVYRKYTWDVADYFYNDVFYHEDAIRLYTKNNVCFQYGGMSLIDNEIK